VAGFLSPASNVHHVVKATHAGFHLEAREVGSGRWRHYDIGPGELCILGAGSAPREICWRSQGPGRTLEVIELYVDPDCLREANAHRAALSLEPEWRVLRDPLLGQLLEGIARELHHPHSDEDSFGDLATELFAVQLQRAHGLAGTPLSARRGGLPPFVLRRVREYVGAHLASRLRLPRLAALAGLSAFHFARAFKVSTGLSPHAYVLHHRILEAKRLLSFTTLSIADIARRTGFNSSGQFSSRFRAATGTTPSTFRDLARP